MPNFVTANPDVIYTNLSKACSLPTPYFWGISYQIDRGLLSLDSVIAGSSSIFGGAKPVDTAAREKEIEERLLRDKQAQKERKEVIEHVHARKPNRSLLQ